MDTNHLRRTAAVLTIAAGLWGAVAAGTSQAAEASSASGSGTVTSGGLQFEHLDAVPSPDAFDIGPS